MSTAPLTREARKEQTREAIIAAATRLFARHGIEATSLDRIAGEVGLTKGAIYSTFSGKDDLVEAVAVATTVAVGPDPLYQGNISLKQALEMLAKDLLAVRRKVTHEVFMLDLELLLYERRHRSWGKRVLAEHRAGIAEFSERLEAAANARGEPLPIPADEFLTALRALARGIVEELDRDPKSLSKESVVKLFVSLAG